MKASIYHKRYTPSVRKYLSSKWMKGDVSRRILVLDTSLFIHFGDKYCRTEGVIRWDLGNCSSSLQCILLRVCLVSIMKRNVTGRFHPEGPFLCLDWRRNQNPLIPENGIFPVYAEPGRSSESAGPRGTPHSRLSPLLPDSPTWRPSQPRPVPSSLPRWPWRRPEVQPRRRLPPLVLPHPAPRPRIWRKKEASTLLHGGRSISGTRLLFFLRIISGTRLGGHAAAALARHTGKHRAAALDGAEAPSAAPDGVGDPNAAVREETQVCVWRGDRKAAAVDLLDWRSKAAVKTGLASCIFCL